MAACCFTSLISTSPYHQSNAFGSDRNPNRRRVVDACQAWRFRDTSRVISCNAPQGALPKRCIEEFKRKINHSILRIDSLFSFSAKEYMRRKSLRRKSRLNRSTVPIPGPQNRQRDFGGTQSLRLSRKTACSPKRFQNHHGALSRSGVPQALSATARSIFTPIPVQSWTKSLMVQ